MILQKSWDVNSGTQRSCPRPCSGIFGPYPSLQDMHGHYLPGVLI